jgi:hypothetical protein
VAGSAAAAVGGTQNLGPPDGLGNVGAAGAASATSAAASGADSSVGGGSAAASLKATSRTYSLRALYFRREMFKSTADCLTAAYTQGLPLEVCR